MIPRYLQNTLKDHLSTLRQMLFLVGPRQVGKTTLAKSMLETVREGINYFNWDSLNHRKLLTTQLFQGKVPLDLPEQKVLVFDEIHKYPRWKNSLKGLFDLNEPNTHWIVTGSAGLNVYRKGQDSLLGRSFTYHLCPLTVAELNQKTQPIPPIDQLATKHFSKPSPSEQKQLESLFQFSGFPEPFFKKEEDFLSKWRATRLERLLNQDLGATERLKNLPLVEQLMFLLPERVGVPLSINSLREDLEVHFNTVKNWLSLLERTFYGFTIYPYTTKLSRAILKEGKWYLWDWTEIEDKGYRFENLVALHLLKYIHYVNDCGLGNLSLHFLRNKEKQEVDFVFCDKKKAKLLIECKWQDEDPSKALLYFANKLNLKRCLQLVYKATQPQSFVKNGIRVDIVPAASFLSQLV